MPQGMDHVLDALLLLDELLVQNGHLDGCILLWVGLQSLDPEIQGMDQYDFLWGQVPHGTCLLEVLQRALQAVLHGCGFFGCFHEGLLWGSTCFVVVGLGLHDSLLAQYSIHGQFQFRVHQIDNVLHDRFCRWILLEGEKL